MSDQSRPGVGPDMRRLQPEDVGLSRFRLRLWHGMTLGAWLEVMRGNWHRVPRSRYPLAVTVTLLATANVGLKLLTDHIYGDRIAATQIEQDPIFVIGHWRSGTTWLHNLLMADPRFAAPSTSECYRPETFLLGRSLFRLLMKRVMMKTRPMDKVVLETSSAEEDEVALLLAWAPSPYRVLLFPDDALAGTTPLLSELSQTERARWWRIWLTFLRSVQMLNPGKQLVLKSPTHSSRLSEILAQFPQARFIHIVRDPFEVVPSNGQMLYTLAAFLSLTDRMSSEDETEMRLLSDFANFQEELHRQLPEVPASQIATIRYEDLRADVPDAMRRIYEGLELGGFDEVEPVYRATAAAQKGYQTNVYTLTPDRVARIEAACGPQMRRYGYLPLADRGVDPS